MVTARTTKQELTFMAKEFQALLDRVSAEEKRSLKLVVDNTNRKAVLLSLEE